MAANSGVVGVLRALLTLDSAQFDTGMRKAVSTTQSTTTALGGLTKEVTKLTPQAERMVKAFGGERQFAAANNLVAAIQRVGGATKLTEADQRRANATLSAAIERYRVLGIEAPKAMLATERATRGASTASGILGSAFATMTASFSTALIVNRVVGGLTSLVNESIRTAGALVDLSGKTGLSTETLQRMSFVADQTGATLDDFSSAAFQLGIRISAGTTPVRKAFGELSTLSGTLTMSFEEFQRLTIDQKFAQIAGALFKVTDEGKRNEIQTTLMGRVSGNVAAAISENYNQMAKAARVSSDQQVHAIDDAVDAWNAFIKAQSVGIQAGLGSAILWARALRQAVDEMGVFASTASVMARARFLIDEGLLTGRKTDIQLTKESAKAHQDYVAQLAAVNAELKRLTPAQLAQIQAAREMGVNASDLEEQYGLTAGALSVLTDNTKGFTKASKDASEQARELHESMDALSTDVFGLADRLEASFDRISDTETFENLKEEINGVADAMDRVAEAGESIPFTSELDIERTRKLLGANAPGSGIFKAARESGETIGHQINEGVAHAFVQVPHFLTSSIIHSGSFINGLKAIGVDMADAIVEPLIKRFIAKIAGAKLIDAVSGGAAGAALGAGAAAGSSFVASEVAGTAAATTAAAGGAGAAGGAAAGGLAGSLAAFATNPFTIAAAAAIGGFLLYKHFHNTANDVRDKDLSQFAAFDTAEDRKDTNNPPGFHGLFRLLTKYSKGALFAPFVTAHDTSGVRSGFAPIQAFVGSLGRSVKSFSMGGFVPPGVVQPAILHGGAYGEDIRPRGPESATGAGVQIVNHWHVSTIDAKGIRDFVQSGDFTYHLGSVIGRNHGFLTTAIRKAL